MSSLQSIEAWVGERHQLLLNVIERQNLVILIESYCHVELQDLPRIILKQGGTLWIPLQVPLILALVYGHKILPFELQTLSERSLTHVPLIDSSFVPCLGEQFFSACIPTCKYRMKCDACKTWAFFPNAFSVDGHSAYCSKACFEKDDQGSLCGRKSIFVGGRRVWTYLPKIARKLNPLQSCDSLFSIGVRVDAYRMPTQETQHQLPPKIAESHALALQLEVVGDMLHVWAFSRTWPKTLWVKLGSVAIRFIQMSESQAGYDFTWVRSSFQKRRKFNVNQDGPGFVPQAPDLLSSCTSALVFT